MKTTAEILMVRRGHGVTPPTQLPGGNIATSLPVTVASQRPLVRTGDKWK